MATLARVATIATALTFATEVCAQDVGNATRELPRQSADHVLVGVGVVAAPTYQGSDQYRVLPIPMIDIVKGPFFANLRNGVGINVMDAGAFTIGASVAIMPGYRQKDIPEGIDQVSVGAGGRLFANLKAGGAVISIGGTQGFAGSTKGVIADASLSYPIMASSRLIVIPSMSATWGDERHNDRYFGVSRSESMESGLPEYRLGEGFKDFSVGITASYRLNNRINLTASGSVATLVDDAKDSPLVERRTQPTGFLSLSYLISR